MTAPFLIVAADFIKTGGMDRANYAFAEYLTRQGAEVHLVGHSVGAQLRGRRNVHWHPVARPWGHDALGWGLLDRAGRRWAHRLVKENGATRVLVNGGNCRWGDLNWIHYVHAAYAAPIAGGPARRGWHQLKRWRCLRDEERALSRARVVIANSDHTRAEIIGRLGVTPERIHTVYYGCDPEQFRPPSQAERLAARGDLGWRPERPVALFLGALGDRRKGFDTLFAAWQRLRTASSWDVDLVVVGRGSELASWRQRAQAAGMDDSCRFLGYRKDMPLLLTACDLLISPTRYEAFGLGVQEALLCALPALVSADAGVAERLLPSLGGLLLHNPDSVEELAARLRWWREQGDELTPALAMLSTSLRAYTWDQMSARIVALAQEGVA